MRVYVISAYPTVRAGLVALIRDQSGWELAGEGNPAALARVTLPARPSAALTSAAPTVEPPPDVVLADLDDAEEAAALDHWLDVVQPRTGFVVLARPADGPARGGAPQQVRFVADVAATAAERGLAFGALLRDASTEEILAALRATGDGLLTLDRRLAGDLFAVPERLANPSRRPLAATNEPLTQREIEVLQVLAQGLPNKTIAARLHISEHTAKFHVSAILMKLGAASRTEAVTLAARRGLLIL